MIFSDCLRRDHEAEKELRAALALNPRYVPALFNLANLMTDLGERDAAIATYEQLLAVDPQSAEGLARYADLKRVAEPRRSRSSADCAQAIARPGATAADKASLGFALGRALDGCGAYDQAFEAYAAANRHSRESAGPRCGSLRPEAAGGIRRRADRRLHARALALRRARAAGPPDLHLRHVPLGLDADRAGARRSLEGERGRRARSHSGPRAHGARPVPGAHGADVRRAARRATPRAISPHLAKLFPGASHVTDKRPDNFLYLGLIKTLFPGAKIINTTRDAVDNCLSIYFLHLDHSMGYALDLMDTAHYYRQYRRLMRHWKSLFGADILDFDYDLFVREPRPAVEKLLAFCGLDWEDDCMAFHRVRNAVKTASAWQVREPLYQRSSGRSRNYARHLGALRAELADLLGPG